MSPEDIFLPSYCKVKQNDNLDHMVRPRKHETSKAFNVNSNKQHKPTKCMPKNSKPIEERKMTMLNIVVFFHEIDYEEYENLDTFDEIYSNNEEVFDPGDIKIS